MAKFKDIKEVKEMTTRNEFIAEQNKTKVEELIKNIEHYENLITEEQKELLRDRGIYIEQILNVDKDKLKTNPEYVQNYIVTIRSFIEQFMEIVSEVL